MLGILEDLLDVLGVPFLHELEDLCGLVPMQLLHDIGRMLGRHLVKDARDLRLVEARTRASSVVSSSPGSTSPARSGESRRKSATCWSRGRRWRVAAMSDGWAASSA